jgi:hypothetical protein
MSLQTTVTDAPAGFDADRHRRIVLRTIARRSFAMLATSSAANRPHVAGVLYATTSEGLVVSTFGEAVKVRNVRQNGRVGVSIPVRKAPIGPPFVVQFQTAAEVLPLEDPLIQRLLAAGELKAITGHGELDIPGGVFIRLRMPRRVVTFGVGVPLLSVMRHPLEANRTVEFEAVDAVPVRR